MIEKIKEAQELLDNTPNASDSKKNALQEAINKAQELVNDSNATEDDYTQGVAVLNKAMESFKSTGKHSGGGSSSAKYKITLLPSENGKVTLSSTEVKAGTSVTVTSVPNDGYMVKDILINGVSVGSNAEVYTVKSVSENMKIQVIFGEKTDLPFIDVEKDRLVL